MSFQLKTYKLLPQKCVNLWADLLDIIGPVKEVASKDEEFILQTVIVSL